MCGGHTVISVNGVIRPFFPNGRGLRQGDPIFSILFNFVPDDLSCILNMASAAGHISPVASHVIPTGVLHL